MPIRWFIALVGVVAVTSGVVLGASPVAVENWVGRPVACGSAFSPDSEPARREENGNRLATTMIGGWATPQEDLTGACERAIGSRPAFAWLLIIAGALTVIGAAVVRDERRRPAASPTAPPAPITAATPAAETASETAAPANQPHRAPPQRWQPPQRVLVVGGVLGAAALGLVLTWLLTSGIRFQVGAGWAAPAEYDTGDERVASGQRICTWLAADSSPITAAQKVVSLEDGRVSYDEARRWAEYVAGRCGYLQSARVSADVHVLDR